MQAYQSCKPTDMHQQGMHVCRLETTRKEIIDGCKLPENNCSPNLINFMEKVMEISGIGDRTYFHDGESLALHPSINIPDWVIESHSLS